MKYDNTQNLLIEWLARFYATYKANTKLGKNNIAIVAEKIAAQLFTIILGKTFKMHEIPNNPGYDCFSENNKIFIQVTNEKDNRKLNKSIQKLAGYTIKNGNRFILFIIDYKKPISSYRINNENTFKAQILNFKNEEDIIDLNDILKFYEEANDHIKAEILNLLNNYFGDNFKIEGSGVFYFSSIENRVFQNLNRKYYGFPVGDDFNDIWRFKKVEARVKQILEKEKQIYLTAPYNRGKTTISRTIAKEYFDKGYSVVVINLTPNMNLFYEKLFLIGKGLVSSFKYLFLIENCHVNKVAFEMCDAFRIDICDIQIERLFIFTSRFKFSNNYAPAYNLDFNEAEITEAITQIGTGKRIINDALNLLGKQNPSFKLLDNYIKNYTINQHTTFDNFAEQFKNQYMESVDVICKNKNIAKTVAFQKLEQLAKENIENDFFTTQENDNTLILFEELADKGLLLQEGQRFQYLTVTDARLFYYATQEGKRHFDDIADSAFNYISNNFKEGKTINDKVAQKIFELLKEKMPDSNTFNRYFFSSFDKFVINDIEQANKLFSLDCGILNYYYLYKIKSDSASLEFLLTHFESFINKNRAAMVDANLFTLENFLIFGGILGTNKSYFLDLLDLTEDEVKRIVNRISTKKSLPKLVKYLSGIPKYKIILDVRFPPKQIDSIVGKPMLSVPPNTCVIDNKVIEGHDFKNYHQMKNLYNNIICQEGIIICSIKLSILGALLETANRDFTNDNRTNILFDASFKFIENNIGEIQELSSSYAKIKITEKFKDFGKRDYISKLKEWFIISIDS